MNIQTRKEDEMASFLSLQSVPHLAARVLNDKSDHGSLCLKRCKTVSLAQGSGPTALLE